MKAFASLLLLFFMEAVYSAETLTSMFSGKDFIDMFDVYSDSVAYLRNSTFIFKSGSLDTKIENVTDLRCNTAKGICIVGTDFVYTTFGVDAAGAAITRQMVYTVRPQTLYRIHSRIAFIEGTDYFLTASLSKYGVNRWMIGKNDSFTQIKPQGLGNALEIADILIIDRSNYALISFATSLTINLIDFVSMTETRSIKGNAGMMALLSADPSLANFVCASENRITKYSYLDGSTIASMTNDYIVTGMKNVNNTDFVVVATWEQVFIYSFSGASSTVWAASPYFYSTTGKQMPGGVRFSQQTATMYFAGLGHVTGLVDTNAAFCHPNCATCNLMLSEYKCATCKSPAVDSSGACKVPAGTSSAEFLKAPPGGEANFVTAKWSEDNMKPAQAKGFNIKDYYLYFIIGAGGLVGLCCVFCICKMCCKNKDEQGQQGNNPNRVHQQQKNDY